MFRTSGRRLVEAGWKAVYGDEAEPEQAEDDSGGDQLLPRLEQGETVDTRAVESMRKETQPPRRFTDASLLGAMETAGKEAEDAELREAMKDSGIGTPATRASIIERLVTVGYLEREGRSLVATEKAIQVVRLLGEHQLTSPELTGNWERRLRLIEQGEDTRPAFMKDITTFTTETVQELDKLKGVKIERAKLGPCPVCGREITENRKGYSCWSREDPGCGFVIWKKKAGKNLPVSVAKELIESLRASRERGEDPGVGRTEKAGDRIPQPRRPHASAPSSGWSRPSRASGGWSSTRSGPRSLQGRGRGGTRRGGGGRGRRGCEQRRRPHRDRPSRQPPPASPDSRAPADQTAGAGSATPSSTLSMRGGPESSSVITVPGQ